MQSTAQSAMLRHGYQMLADENDNRSPRCESKSELRQVKRNNAEIRCSRSVQPQEEEIKVKKEIITNQR